MSTEKLSKIAACISTKPNQTYRLLKDASNSVNVVFLIFYFLPLAEVEGSRLGSSVTSCSCSGSCWDISGTEVILQVSRIPQVQAAHTHSTPCDVNAGQYHCLSSNRTVLQGSLSPGHGSGITQLMHTATICASPLSWWQCVGTDKLSLSLGLSIMTKVKQKALVNIGNPWSYRAYVSCPHSRRHKRSHDVKSITESIKLRGYRCRPYTSC